MGYILTGACLSRVEYAYTTGELGAPLNTLAYGYDDTLGWKDLLTSYGGQDRSYDTIGNLISDGVWAYTWQGGRQLASMAKDGASVSFAYDEKGLRLSKTVNDVVTRYTYSQGELIHVLDGSDVMRIRRDPNGQPMTIGFNGSEHFYLYNAQGDVVAIANYSGQVVVEYTYDAWGNPLSCTGSLADTLGRKNPFRYRGYVYDEETGLYYLKSRYYDPRVGRFICSDKVFDHRAGMLLPNTFAYCANNPINLCDTSGHLLWEIIGTIIIGGAVGGITYAILTPSSYDNNPNTPTFGDNFWEGFKGNAIAAGIVSLFYVSPPAGASVAQQAVKFGVVTGFGAAASETITTIFTPDFDALKITTTFIANAIHGITFGTVGQIATAGLNTASSQLIAQGFITIFDQLPNFFDYAIDTWIDQQKAANQQEEKVQQMKRTGNYWNIQTRNTSGRGWLCRN